MNPPHAQPQPHFHNAAEARTNGEAAERSGAYEAAASAYEAEADIRRRPGNHGSGDAEWPSPRQIRACRGLLPGSTRQLPHRRRRQLRMAYRAASGALLRLQPLRGAFSDGMAAAVGAGRTGDPDRQGTRRHHGGARRRVFKRMGEPGRAMRHTGIPAVRRGKMNGDWTPLGTRSNGVPLGLPPGTYGDASAGEQCRDGLGARCCTDAQFGFVLPRRRCGGLGRDQPVSGAVLR